MQPKQKLLIAEDDQMIREMYARALRNAGFDVVEAADGQAAYDLMEKNDGLNLVLLDIMMPNLSGIDVLKKIKENNIKHDFKTLMLTNLDQDQMLYDCLANGAIGYIIKDQFPPHELVQEVRRHLG